MKKRVLCLILPVLTLILEIIPYGAVCNFARPASDGSIGHFRQLYSYFDMVPFGYANFSPLITAVLTCVVLLLTVISFITGGGRVRKLLRNLLVISVIISLCPLLYGIQFFSIVGVLISASLLAQTFIVQAQIKEN